MPGRRDVPQGDAPLLFLEEKKDEEKKMQYLVGGMPGSRFDGGMRKTCFGRSGNGGEGGKGRGGPFQDRKSVV